MLNLFRPYHKRKLYHGDYFLASELTEETFTLLKEKLIKNKIELDFGFGINNTFSIHYLVARGAEQFVISYLPYKNEYGENYILYNSCGGTRKIDVNRYLFGY